METNQLTWTVTGDDRLFTSNTRHFHHHRWMLRRNSFFSLNRWFFSLFIHLSGLFFLSCIHLSSRCCSWLDSINKRSSLSPSESHAFSESTASVAVSVSMFLMNLVMAVVELETHYHLNLHPISLLTEYALELEQVQAPEWFAYDNHIFSWLFNPKWNIVR